MTDTFFENDVDFNSLPEATGNFELIPPNTEVPAVAVASQLKTKSETGSISFYYEFQIIDGPYKGYRIWQNFNWKNNNEKAQIIGQNEVKTFLSAVGFTGKFNDTTQLHDKPITLVIDVEESSGLNPKTGQPYPAKNVIKGSGSKIGIKPYQGNLTAPVANNATTQSTASNKPAWAK